MPWPNNGLAHRPVVMGRRGHELWQIADWSILFGGGQGILVDPDSGAFLAGADPRRDGYTVAF